MQTPEQSRITNVEERTTPWLTSSAQRAAGAIRLLQNGFCALGSTSFDHHLDGLEPRNLFGNERPPPVLAELYRHSASHIWPEDATTLRRSETDPDNYQWYLQQIAQNKADKLYSTQMNIREANEHGGGPLGNDILHGSRVVNLPKQRTDGVYSLIRQAAIAQGILRPTNRWRNILKVPHKQKLEAQQSRADLMCLQRLKTNGPDYPEMLGINPNIAPLTVRRTKVHGG